MNTYPCSKAIPGVYIHTDSKLGNGVKNNNNKKIENDWLQVINTLQIKAYRTNNRTNIF